MAALLHQSPINLYGIHLLVDHHQSALCSRWDLYYRQRRKENFVRARPVRRVMDTSNILLAPFNIFITQHFINLANKTSIYS